METQTKEKIELKHLTPYLEHGLRIDYKRNQKPKTFKLSVYNVMKVVLVEEWKPILRPLSDLTKEIEHNGEKFVPLQKLYEDFKITMNEPYKNYKDSILFGCNYNGNPEQSWLYCRVIILFKWHFDVFGLIEKGLAIDINTL